LRALGRRLAWFNNYTPQQSIGLYPTDGTTVDFAYGDLGVAAYTYELGTDFFQDCGSFEATILPDNLESLRYAAKVARTPYLTPGGPDVVEVDFAGVTVVAPGEPVTFRARLDDSRFNQSSGSEPIQNIAEASAYLDAPPWQSGAVAIAMQPEDGSFNTPQEWATVDVDTTGLATGRHTLFAIGRDASGAWGTTSAAFFWVLDPTTAPRIAGDVRSADIGLPLAATVTAGAFSTATDPGDGSYELMLPPGTYNVTAVANGYAPFTAEDIPAVTGATTPLDFYLAPYEQVFFDDVEAGNIGWTPQSPWAITTEASSSPIHSWTDSPGTNYADYRNVSLTSPVLDLTGMTGATLEFDHIYDLESGYDFGYVEVSADGGTSWEAVASYTGLNHTSWETATIAMPQLDGIATARIRFRLETDSSVTADGWHVDDILVRAGGGGSTYQPFSDGFESGDTSAWSVTVP
jgi:carboxypeptidase T